MNRVNESTFNSPLFAEYRAIEFVARLIDQGRLPRGLGPNRYRRVNAHLDAGSSLAARLWVDCFADATGRRDPPAQADR
jgi:hypothetical protein